MTLFVGLVSFRFVFFLLAPKAQFGSGLIPILAVPVSTSTLCVSRQRSSPLSSVLRGIDDVKMFSDFGFPPVPLSRFKVLVPRSLPAKELLATS